MLYHTTKEEYNKSASVVYCFKVAFDMPLHLKIGKEKNKKTPASTFQQG